MYTEMHTRTESGALVGTECLHDTEMRKERKGWKKIRATRSLVNVPCRTVPYLATSYPFASFHRLRPGFSPLFFSSLFVLLFPIDSQNSSIFIAVNVAAENTDRIEELNEKSHFESVTTFNLALFLCSFYHDKIKLEMWNEILDDSLFQWGSCLLMCIRNGGYVVDGGSPQVPSNVYLR